MASTVIGTTCPHCRKAIKIPEEFVGRTVRCKGCSKTFTANGKPSAAKSDAPKAVVPTPVKSEPTPAQTPDTYVKRMARQQRSSTVIYLVLAAVALGALGAGFYTFKDQLFGMVNKAVTATKPTAPENPGSLLLNNEEVLDKNSGDLTNLPDPDQDKRDKRKLARIPSPYPGRALLIGIRNYLYLNPLNPGYRAERSFQRDPLGLHTLRRTLITELSFPRDQVVVLSDMDDQKPTVPTKATIEVTVEDFLATSSSSDHIVLVLAVHAITLGGKGYLVPVDGELPVEGAKPDTERDAKLAAKMIPLSWLYDKLAACKARQKLVIFDIAQNDPEAGIVRNAPSSLDETLYKQIEAMPKGVQVWLACKPKQHSNGLSSSGQNGSVFIDSLCQLATLSIEKNWKAIEKDPGLKNGTLPLLLLAKQVNAETTKYLKEHGFDQTPELLGKEEPAAVATTTTVSPAVELKIKKPDEPVVSGMEIAHVIKELGIESDHARNLSPSSFPPLLQSAYTKYAADYASNKELEDKLTQYPLRSITLKAIKTLDRSLKTFRMRFAEESDEANFKKKIEKEQETPAYVTAELSDLLDDMKKLDEKRDEEPSLRWRAHFDYTQARLLAQLAHVQEYSFVLGNKLRKDTPKIKDEKNHNGWIIVSQRKLEQKETRTYDSERQKLLTKIIKENPGTPWEILARREQATILGLTLQETYLEEGKPLMKGTEEPKKSPPAK
ncbi:MAG TPA: caspase family protein [Gemmatales bacterium]|nr:caspase family protein [Gemmatales bacterium]